MKKNYVISHDGDDVTYKATYKRSGSGLDDHRTLKLYNYTGPWTKPSQRKLKLSIYDVSNTKGKAEVTLKTEDDLTIEMNFLDLHNLYLCLKTLEKQGELEGMFGTPKIKELK